jgi:hypothetical protein
LKRVLFPYTAHHASAAAAARVTRDAARSLGMELVERGGLASYGPDSYRKGLSAPGALTLDVANGKMYWTDSAIDKIQRANLDGSGVEDLIITYSGGPAKGGGQRYGLALATRR